MSSPDPPQVEFPGPVPLPAPAWGAAISAPSAVRLPAVPVEPLLPRTLAATPNALDLLKALRRRWALALTLGTLCAATAAAITWCLVPPPKYRARAVFLMASASPQIIFKTTEARADFNTYTQTHINLIRSQRVLKRALDLTHGDIAEFLKKEGLRPTPAGGRSGPASGSRIGQLESLRDLANPVAWLESQFTVDRSGEALRISLSGSQPDDLAPIINAISCAYKEEVVDEELRERTKRLEELEKLYNHKDTGYQAKLRLKRAALRQRVMAAGSADKETRAKSQQLANEQRAMVEREQLQFESELRRAKTELKVLESRSRGRGEVPITDAAVEEELARVPDIRSSIAEIGRLRMEVDRVRKKVRNENDPAVQEPLRRQKAYQAALAERRAQLRPAIVQALSAKKPDSATDLQQAKVETIEELLTLTRKEVNALAGRSEAMTAKTLDLEEEQDAIAHAEDAARRIGDEIEALKVELNANPRVRLFEPAETPRPEDERRQFKMVGLSGAGAFAFILLGVSWFESRARRIDSADEVVHGLGMRIVGTLPAMPDRVRRRVAVSSGTQGSPWYRLLIESVDATRTMLLHAAHAESYRIIMVTSALGGEGKTSLSSHLASSLARAGRRTLLVDCDLRNPAAHRLFDLTLEPGVCELLRGEADLADTIRPSAINGLSMITAGSCDGRAIQGLAQDGIREIFDRLRDQFDFIVVDSAPVLPVADSLLICQHVDAVIFSILRDVSRVTKVYAAQAMLAALGTRTMGAIVTGVRSETYGKGYAAYGKDYAA